MPSREREWPPPPPSEAKDTSPEIADDIRDLTGVGGTKNRGKACFSRSELIQIRECVRTMARRRSRAGAGAAAAADGERARDQGRGMRDEG